MARYSLLAIYCALLNPAYHLEPAALALQLEPGISTQNIHPNRYIEWKKLG